MAELKKVMKGLRCMSTPYEDLDDRDCENCKYDNASCFLDVPADALSLLKTQEARIAELEAGQEPIHPEDFDLIPDNYVRIGDVLDLFDGMNISDDTVFHAVGLIRWAMGKRDITPEELKNELLKAQEPVKPKRASSSSGVTWWNICGNCKTAINPNDKYCHECGRVVQWE